MQITLEHFERIDSLMASLLRMGPFETCSDPVGYIRTENRLLDACIDGTTYDYASSYASAVECAAEIVACALIGKVDVVDELA